MHRLNGHIAFIHRGVTVWNSGQKKWFLWVWWLLLCVVVPVAGPQESMITDMKHLLESSRNELITLKAEMRNLKQELANSLKMNNDMRRTIEIQHEQLTRVSQWQQEPQTPSKNESTSLSNIIIDLRNSYNALKIENYDLEMENRAKSKTIFLIIMALVILALAWLLPRIIKLLRKGKVIPS